MPNRSQGVSRNSWLSDVRILERPTRHKLRSFLLSRFNNDPRTRHLTAAKRVLRYLKRTKGLRLVYTSGDLHDFVDADHANGKSKKSVGGYIFLLGGAAISWDSNKRAPVALSTEEVEYTAFRRKPRSSLDPTNSGS